jgi:hypothetical protein
MSQEQKPTLVYKGKPTIIVKVSSNVKFANPESLLEGFTVTTSSGQQLPSSMFNVKVVEEKKSE